MRIFKSQVLLRLINSYIIDSPEPANISYLWNFGSLLGTCLVLQILTGIFLAMHYIPNVDMAFTSVEHTVLTDYICQGHNIFEFIINLYYIDSLNLFLY